MTAIYTIARVTMPKPSGTSGRAGTSDWDASLPGHGDALSRIPDDMLVSVMAARASALSIDSVPVAIRQQADGRRADQHRQSP
jgi:hypothetical protein